MAQADGPEALENALAAGLRGLRAEALGQVRPGRGRGAQGTPGARQSVQTRARRSALTRGHPPSSPPSLGRVQVNEQLRLVRESVATAAAREASAQMVAIKAQIERLGALMDECLRLDADTISDLTTRVVALEQQLGRESPQPLGGLPNGAYRNAKPWSFSQEMAKLQ